MTPRRRPVQRRCGTENRLSDAVVLDVQMELLFY